MQIRTGNGSNCRVATAQGTRLIPRKGAHSYDASWARKLAAHTQSLPFKRLFVPAKKLADFGTMPSADCVPQSKLALKT